MRNSEYVESQPGVLRVWCRNVLNARVDPAPAATLDKFKCKCCCPFGLSYRTRAVQ